VTDVRRLLDAVRSELRATILPKIEGDYERSVVIAMLGILGDLRDEVAPDEAPIAAEAARLRAASGDWIAALGESPLAGRVADAVAKADAAAGAAERRTHLLEAAETLVRELWADSRLASLRDELLPRIRRDLKGKD
jgi:hypothetical protein